MARHEEKKNQVNLKKEAPAHNADRKVLMVFSEDQFYNDLQKPKYDKHKVHEVAEERPGYIERWLPRGGIILTEKEAADYEKGKQVVPESAPDMKLQKPSHKAPAAEEKFPDAPMSTSDMGDESSRQIGDETEENEIEL